MTAGAAAQRPARQLPEPARFWVRYRPRRWPAPEVCCTDLAAGGLLAAAGKGGEELPELATGRHGAPFDDLVYLPPVPAALDAARVRRMQTLVAAGTPVLFQLLPGAAPPAPAGGALVVYDPLPALLSGDAALLAPPAGAGVSAAVWPLVAGLSDAEALADGACSRLAAAGVRAVQAVALKLSPGDRRAIAEAAVGELFDAVFHQPPPDERRFARIAAAHGLAPLLPRPLPPASAAGNRRLAGLLATAGELWLRLGRSEPRGQALFRAARWADTTAYDLAALARDGHLSVVEALDPDSRALIEEAVAAGDAQRYPARVRQLVEDYAGGAGEAVRRQEACDG